MTRTNDILAFQGFGSTDPVRLVFQTSDLPSRAVTGVLKLMQKVLVLFLTDLGSVRYKPTEGTTFIRTLFGNSLSWSGTGDIISLASSAVVDVRRQIVDEEDLYGPDDERLASITVDDATIVDTTVFLQITIETLSGLSRQITLPVQTAVPTA